MKKHLTVLISIVLIVLVIGAVVFFFLKAQNSSDNRPGYGSADSTVSASEIMPYTEPVKLYKIGIVHNGLGNASKDCYEGFITELNESGILDKVEIVYIVEDNKELCREKIESLVKNGCDLLYTIGRYASETAAAVTKEIPIVFGAVNSPDEVGLVESNEAPGGNVTGVSSYTPCFEQIDLIKMVLPEAKSVAALYSATDADAVLQGIVASKEAESIGIKCDQYPIEDEKALKSALESIKKAKTNVIYIPVDKFLSAHIGTLNDFSYENKIPVICGDEATLELGAFATSTINYASIGSKAAGMANDILFNGKSPATLSVNYKHDCTNMINRPVMKKLGITIPATALPDVEMWEPPTEAATAPPAETKAPAKAESATEE